MLLQTFWIYKSFPLPEPQTGLGVKFSQAERVFLMHVSSVVEWKNTPCNVLYFLFRHSKTGRHTMAFLLLCTLEFIQSAILALYLNTLNKLWVILWYLWCLFEERKSSDHNAAVNNKIVIKYVQILQYCVLQDNLNTFPQWLVTFGSSWTRKGVNFACHPPNRSLVVPLLPLC